MPADSPFVAVSKEAFREAYFRYGRPAEGWTEEHWRRTYEQEGRGITAYLVQAPASPQNSRMMIVDDVGRGEARMFFLTEEEEDGFFRLPGA